MDRLISLASLVVVLSASSAFAEVGLRLDSASARSWQPMPAWLGNPSATATVSVKDGALDFAVPEPGKGMKWRLGFEPVDTFVYRWLVVRYRLVGYAPKAPDYLVWCEAKTQKDGLRLLPPQPLPWDDRPHTVAFNLQKREVGDQVAALAVQCQAGLQGGAHVLVTAIEFTDRPPEGAEGDVAPAKEARTMEADVLRPDLWKPRRDWLGNPTDKIAVKAADGNLRFEVNDPGAGMKWSTDLAQAIEGMQWLSVRCRAANLDPQTWNYFLYLASAGGGKAPQEQYCLNLSDVPLNGEWHVVSAPVTVGSIRTLALQVQAAGSAAYAEIDWLRFSTVKPEVALADVLPFQPLPALPPGQQALALPEPLVPAAEAASAMEVTSWFATPLVSVRGVGFALAQNGAQLAATSYQQPGEIKLSADVKASEIYLLLGARFARMEEPSYGGGRLRRVVDPHRFVVAVTYDDATVDEFVPERVRPQTADRRPQTYDYGVYSGIDVYAVGPLPEKRVREVVLRDGMRNGAFYLAAATANTGPARSAAPQPEGKPYTVAPPPAMEQARETRSTYERRDGVFAAAVSARANDLRVSFTAKDALDPAVLSLQPQGLAPLDLAGPLFEVRVQGQTLGLDRFRATAAEAVPDQRAVVRLTGTTTVGEAKVGCVLTLAAEERGRLALRLELKNEGNAPLELQPTFPVLPPLKPPADWGNTWYFFPRRGCVINHVPIGLREAYSGAFPFQVESVFWPDRGLGLYLMTRDLDLTFRYFRLSKDAEGVRMSVEYPSVTLAPGETWRSVDTVLGESAGDWHGAWQAYQDWMATWYRPAAPRKAWFRSVFNFRQQFMHFALPEKSGIFDDATKTYRFQEAVDADSKAFGGVDYLHLFDWGWSEKFGRCGDYDHWEQIGGAPAFANAIAGLQTRDVPVGLYIEGYLVDPESNYGKAHGAEYQLLGPEGKPYDYFAPSYNMCSAVREWQDYLAGVYRRTREATGALGYYVDEMGFTDPGHLCYAKTHGHPVPYPPAPGQRELMRKIREALGPECALYTEESPPDVTSQYQDGSFTYNIASVSDEWSPTHLNLYRFTVPTLKTFEIITCDQPLGSNLQAVKRVFFGGEGIWIEGLADRWFTPETRATIAHTHAVLTRYSEAFTSDAPTPLVPTLRGNVCANEFPAGDGKQLTVWTLYNANPRTLRGAVLRVPHVPGAKYVDAWNDRPAAAKIEGNEAVISLDLGPRDVGCVARTAEGALPTKPERAALLICDGLENDEANGVYALLIGENITVARTTRIPAALPNADVVIVDSRAKSRSAFDYAASVAGRDPATRPKLVLLVHSPDELKAAHDAGADACFTLPLGDEFRRIVSRLIEQAHQGRKPGR